MYRLRLMSTPRLREHHRPAQVQRVYLLLTLLTTLAASFIWGVNTLFLLDAGLNNTEAFAANAFFSVGMVIFEVPTGVVADTRGRRFSFMLGAATLLLSTLLYLVMWQIEAPFIGWAFASILLGLGFTFFSGATEAWLVDASARPASTGQPRDRLRPRPDDRRRGHAGRLGAGRRRRPDDRPGVPYVLRAVMLGVALLAAFLFMRDLGFNPKTGVSTGTAVKDIARGSIDGGLRNRPVRWMMLAAPFTGGVGFYAFYAMQPYLLELYGDLTAYSIAGLAAAIVAGAQIVGGLSVPIVRRFFSLRTNALFLAVVLRSLASWWASPSWASIRRAWAGPISTWPSCCWCCGRSSPRSRGRSAKPSSTASSRRSNAPRCCRSIR